MATETKKKATTKKAPAKKAEAKISPVDLSRFAIVDLNGNQLKVHEGYSYTVEKIPGEKGEEVRSEKVLLIAEGKDVKVGKPYVDKASVTFEIETQKKDKKQKVFKYKAKARYRRTYGQRQLITRVKVKEIQG